METSERNVIVKITLHGLTLYKRWLSPLLPRACRFTPTCSEYAAEAIGRNGVVRGGAMAAWRILRCNPLCKSGFDPVPTSSELPIQPRTQQLRTGY